MAPKTKEQFAQIRQRSQQAILDAALSLFAEKGYFATSISMIAKEAGVSKGLMYNYYGGKEDLLRAIIYDAVETGENWMNEEMSTQASPEEHLIHIVELMIHQIKENPRYWRLMTSLAFQREALAPIMLEIEDKKEKTMEMSAELFRSMGYEDPMTEALFFGATLDGIMMQFLAIGDEYPMDTMKEHLIKRFCHRGNPFDTKTNKK
ncbi:MAG: TetR/AcrR family transcriptional regulator [Bacteroidota bacterium]